MVSDRSKFPLAFFVLENDLDMMVLIDEWRQLANKIPSIFKKY